MGQEHLKRSNRALLDAIEVPPDSGLEPRSDSLAARLWAAGHRTDDPPDPGEVCRLERKLARLETQAIVDLETIDTSTGDTSPARVCNDFQNLL